MGLTTKQISEIQKVFDTSFPAIRRGYDELKKQVDELDRLIQGGTADESTFKLHVRLVETVRSQNNEDRFLMDWKIHKLLTADQNVKLKAVLDKRRAAREPRGGGPGPREPRRP